MPIRLVPGAKVVSEHRPVQLISSLEADDEVELWWVVFLCDLEVDAVAFEHHKVYVAPPESGEVLVTYATGASF